MKGMVLALVAALVSLGLASMDLLAIAVGSCLSRQKRGQ